MKTLQYHPLSIEEEQRLAQTKPHPYSFHITIESSELLACGVSHTRNPAHPQFPIIQKLVHIFQPTCVLLELPADIISVLQQTQGEERISKFGESGIITQELPKSIIIIGADLSSEDSMRQVRAAHQFAEEDLAIVELLHRTEAKVRRFQKPPLNIIKEELKHAPNAEQILTKISECTLAIHGKPLADLTPQDAIAPSPLETKTVFNQIVRKTAEIRDKHMLQTIIQAITKHSKVLFIAGRNHVLRHEKYLKEYYAT